VTDREPERLRVLGASDLERQLLAAAGAELPDAELRARMARAIGLGALGAGVAAAGGARPPAGSTLAWPAVKATVAALALAGAAIGYASHRSRHAPPAAVAAQPAPLPERQPETRPALPAPPVEGAPATPRRRRTATAAPTTDLRAEIALLDAARAAIAGGADDRALVLLRRYETRYPAGAFRPESAALRIEALARLGQTREARALGAAFLADHPDSPLAPRVRRALAAPAP
jgi:TolA-binding protein